MPFAVLLLAAIPWFWWKTTWRDGLWRFLAFLALVPLAYLPLLAVREFEVTFRNQVVLGAILAASAFWGLAVVLDRLCRLGVPRLLLTLVVLVAAFRTFSTGRSFADMLAAEHSAVKEQVLSKAASRQVVFVKFDGEAWSRARGPWSEFNTVASVMPPEYGIFTTMTALIARDHGIAPPKSVQELPPGAPLPTGPDVVVIDLRPLAPRLAAQ